METKSILENNFGEQNNNLEIDWKIIEYLREAGKWAKFLSILGFILIGFLVLGSFFVGAIFSAIGESSNIGISGPFITLFYLIVAVIAFFPTFYMYKFSAEIKNAIELNNNNALSTSFKNLKSYFRFNGIITIISLVFYAIFFIIMLIGLMTAGASFIN